MKPPTFSTPKQLSEIASAICSYMRLPLSPKTIPGAYLEALIAHIHHGEILDTYDFVDVIHSGNSVGWQVKSTKENTPVTWKRAKIPNKEALVKASRISEASLQKLGDAIIDFCNEHVEQSFKRYSLEVIAFSRLILHADNRVTYYERQLCTRNSPMLFNPKDFSWHWTKEKITKSKEQKSALHGMHIKSNSKWFAAHILGENQLHFAGEPTWWPKKGSPYAITFNLPDPSKKLSLSELVGLIDRYDSQSSL